MSFAGGMGTLADMWWGWGHHPWLWGGLMMILGWLLIIGLVVLVVRAVGGPRSGRPTGDSAGEAERILAERYARGEIDEQEYRARLSVLKERR